MELHDVDHGIAFLSNLPEKKHPAAKRFYYAALCGFDQLVEHLFSEYPQHANDIGSNYGSALHVASDAGHVHIVQSLLNHGVDMEVRGLWNRTPLQFA